MTNKRKCQMEKKFQSDGAATLKQLKASVVWIRGTDNRLVLEEHRERETITDKLANQYSA